MVKKSSSSSSENFENSFMWLATALGFLVDTITLIGLSSAFELINANTTEISQSIQVPKIRIITTPPGLKEGTLVLIVFSLLMLMLLLGSIFYKRDEERYGDDNPDDNPRIIITPINGEFPLLFFVFGVSLFTLISVLWILVFYFPNGPLWNFMYLIFMVWLVGTFISLFMISVRSLNNREMKRVLKKLLLVSAYSILPLGLIVEWLFHITLLISIVTVIKISFLSICYAMVVLLLTALLSGFTWAVTTWYYSTN